MTITTVTLSEKGQIAIPQSVRESIGLIKGDELVMLQLNGRIILEKSKKVEKKLIEDWSDITKLNESSLKEIWDNDQDDIWGNYLKK